MNASRLMIGDIVRVKEPDRYAGAIGVIKSLHFHKEDEGAYYYILIQGGMGCTLHEVYSEDIEPVPLTQALLDANGFKETVYDEHDRPLFGIRELKSIQGFRFISWKDSCAIQMNVKYAHQLQHALRLSEQNDFADNFKIV